MRKYNIKVGWRTQSIHRGGSGSENDTGIQITKLQSFLVMLFLFGIIICPLVITSVCILPIGKYIPLGLTAPKLILIGFVTGLLISCVLAIVFSKRAMKRVAQQLKK